MFKNRDYVFFINDVPSSWIFEHYLNLDRTLTGQSVKILSVFTDEKTPSLCIYYSVTTCSYLFMDFSSSYGGDGIILVCKLFNLSYPDAINKILADYNSYLKTKDSTRPSLIEINHEKYDVTDYTIGTWKQTDATYWQKFGIGSDLLDKYNVRPLDSYKMSKLVNGVEVSSFTVSRNNIYGYFTKEGEIYKIYQPLIKQRKFIKLATEYIQGSDQLNKSNKFLVICSSLKDVMSFLALGFKGIDAIAPDSENTILSPMYIQQLRFRYSRICVILDNDAAGLKAMMKYNKMYGLPYIQLQMEKDIADSVREHGVQNTRIVLYPMLSEKLTGRMKFL
jgi:DNA primase